ncbi:hypothetical protein CMI48_02360, partial [Candidatus Pacearchaeota archaeon]|nr:hypothetical protein [Candidatus Pacearchaeota archaeon]
DTKQTIEKPVRQKPSVQDLTTIEQPGRPTPASDLEPKKKRKPRRKTIARAPSNQKRDQTLIITEKPQAAEKIATALGQPMRKTQNRVSYYELKDKKILVASAVGHLHALTQKKGQKGWPIFQTEWVPAYTKKAAFTKPYHDLLVKLASRAKEFVIATDFDTEGEVIGWNVLRFIAKQETAKRMKYSTLTKPELQEAYNNLLPEPNWPQAYAGETRHYLDWFYGINLSRALMAAIKTAGAFKILSIGRVQGPALKLIVDREREISSFKSEPYWNIYATTPSNKTKYKHPKDIFKKEELEQFKDIKEASSVTKNTEESIQPPTPFDLTTLQREAYRLHKMPPSQVLKAAQKLYLDGLISYPRTSSQKIPSAIKPKSILKKLAKHFPAQVKQATRTKPIEGRKSDPAHPSIYPTGDLGSPAAQEAKLLTLIIKRFISCFSPDAKTANRRTVLTALDEKGKPKTYAPTPSLSEAALTKSEQQGPAELASATASDNSAAKQQGGGGGPEQSEQISKPQKITFTASGLKILEKGWTNIYPTFLEEKDIPDLNGKTKISKITTEEKETQPPKRYTPTGLLTTLERKNLGTKATRSQIIETLFNRGYLDGKSIKATPLGMHLIESLEQYSPIIIDENLTRKFEEHMQEFDKISQKESNNSKTTRSTSQSKDTQTPPLASDTSAPKAPRGGGGTEADAEQIPKESNLPQILQTHETKVLEEAKKILTDISKDFKAKEKQIGKALAKGITNLREKQAADNTLTQTCPTCNNGPLRITYSPKYKRSFISCSTYPKCTQTYSLPPGSLIKPANKPCDSCKFPKLLSIKKARKPWEFCFNIECETNIKRRDAWEKKKANTD